MAVTRPSSQAFSMKITSKHVIFENIMTVNRSSMDAQIRKCNKVYPPSDQGEHIHRQLKSPVQ